MRERERTTSAFTNKSDCFFRLCFLVYIQRSPLQLIHGNFACSGLKNEAHDESINTNDGDLAERAFVFT
jgi:hypothetical protein